MAPGHGRLGRAIFTRRGAPPLGKKKKVDKLALSTTNVSRAGVVPSSVLNLCIAFATLALSQPSKMFTAGPGHELWR